MLLGSAVAWPIVASAEQAAIPVVGILYSGSSEMFETLILSFRQVLTKWAIFEGRQSGL
jgi:hypothetical protein